MAIQAEHCQWDFLFAFEHLPFTLIQIPIFVVVVFFLNTKCKNLLCKWKIKIRISDTYISIPAVLNATFQLL